MGKGPFQPVAVWVQKATDDLVTSTTEKLSFEEQCIPSKLMSETTQLKKIGQSPKSKELYAYLLKNYPKAKYYSIYDEAKF